ncbi:hypothetical protein BKA62DRAFT_745128 [Auriculariales sp. MPI-PUGE-AT-0066]|nr:hypothetical protein BKA62DRAFT_745128 [Auriculariales sp. MPI-PUGE-AT-0066]
MAAFDISRGHAPPASKTSRSDTVSEATTLYPPDKFGDEASDNARVWNVYRDSAIETDNELLGRWNEALTAILVFAGLFSAVVTAFVIESTRRLQPDPAEYTARAVLAVLSHMNGSTISPIEVVNPAFFSAGATARTINSFWYFGLTTALAVSLLAILAKQWLLEYHARIRAPAKHARYWAWRHFAFKRGLEKWNIDLFISLLSFAMHLAFGSFFAGLLLTLFPVDWIVSAVVTLVTLSVFIVYSVATLAPLWLGDAPMLTPLLIHADRGMRAVISRDRWTCRPYFASLESGLSNPGGG